MRVALHVWFWLMCSWIEYPPLDALQWNMNCTWYLIAFFFLLYINEFFFRLDITVLFVNVSSRILQITWITSMERNVCYPFSHNFSQLSGWNIQVFCFFYLLFYWLCCRSEGLGYVHAGRTGISGTGTTLNSQKNEIISHLYYCRYLWNLSVQGGWVALCEIGARAVWSS